MFKEFENTGVFKSFECMKIHRIIFLLLMYKRCGSWLPHHNCYLGFWACSDIYQLFPWSGEKPGWDHTKLLAGQADCQVGWVGLQSSLYLCLIFPRCIPNTTDALQVLPYNFYFWASLPPLSKTCSRKYGRHPPSCINCWQSFICCFLYYLILVKQQISMQ